MIFKNFKNCPKNEISLLLQVRPITVYKTVHRSGDKNRTSRYPFQNFVFYYTVWILLFGILQSRSSTLLTSALCYIHSLYAFDIRKWVSFFKLSMEQNVVSICDVGNVSNPIQIPVEVLLKQTTWAKKANRSKQKGTQVEVFFS